MTPLEWFSAAARLAVWIEGQGIVSEVRSVFVLRAEYFEDALPRAVEHGRGLERSFSNGDGERVRMKLIEIETLDLLGDMITDGREIYSESLDPAGDLPAGSEPSYDPVNSKPTQSGV